jgi:hypothetical protein
MKVLIVIRKLRRIWKVGIFKAYSSIFLEEAEKKTELAENLSR